VHRRSFLRSAGAGLTAVLASCNRRLRSFGPPASSPPLASPFLFATGIENSYPRLPDGTRHDQLEQGGHYERWRDDFGLASSLGVGALRYGPAWYRTNPAPGQYDWSSVDEQMRWLEKSGLVVVADLCHFGTPDWITGFQDVALRVHLAEYAREFARRYSFVSHFTPINETFVAANFSAMMGWWNDCATGKTSFARAIANVSIAHELAVEAILAERPNATIVQVESIERFSPADDSAEAIRQAEFWNAARFAALDLTTGRTPASPMLALLTEAGMTTADFAFLREPRARGQRWLGVDYYVTSEQLVDDRGRKRPSRDRVGLAALGCEYYDRYRVPLFISETSRVASRAVDWLDEQWDETKALMADGVPVRGFTWFPLGDVIDWRHALRVKRGDVDPIGLYSLDREARSVAAAYRALIRAGSLTPARAPAAGF
jgi:beta-glucosidase/6-phospho-beta-glucosidase/beta-galactosidase